MKERIPGMKTNAFTRFLTCALALLLAFSALFTVACADQEVEDEKDPAQSEQDPDSEKEKVEEEPRVLPDVPDGDYDYTVNVMHWLINGHDFVWEETCPDEDITSHSGDLIADAIYDRTAWIEENYGFTITKGYQEHVAMPAAVSSMISSGSDDYQMQIEFSFGAQRSFGKNYYLEKSLAELRAQTREQWQLRIEGQLYNSGVQLNVTDYDELQGFIQQYLGDWYPQEVESNG
jgi:hypothetical protein